MVDASEISTEIIDTDDRHREAYAMRRAGRRVEEIAAHFSVDRSTIWRWIESYKAAFRLTLESTPVLNLIADELAGLDDLEREARRSALETKNDRAKAAFLNAALRATQTRTRLLLEIGIVPRMPERVYRTVESLKPAELRDDEPERRTDEEIRFDIQRLLEVCPTFKG